ncbi:MAG: 2OG-Fe(II) oxygenase [Myxococcales bacterium]|nr:2OG-Fe(II) oxygenase [Myxococcales bacterium]MCB9551357.1 2OG-Fe(II) oxygenase [Myxococcales bacterium]
MFFDPVDPHLRGMAYVNYCRGVIDPATCAAVIADAEARGFAEAPINLPGGEVRRTDIRDNDRVMYDDPALAARLWEALAPHCPARVGEGEAVGLNERFRVYRYAVGQRFMMHRDGWFARDARERSRLTVLVYLNDDYAGGRTEFDGGHGVDPETGAALLFAHSMKHRGAPVERGRKYVLRTDVMYRDR